MANPPAFVLDAHIHVLSAEKARLVAAAGGPARLSRPWAIGDLRAEQPRPIPAIVMDSDRPFPGENERLLDLALQYPDLVAGVIGRLELGRPDFADALGEIDAHPAGERWRGPRLALRPDIAEPWTPGLVADRTAQLVTGGRVLELLVPADRLAEAIAIAEASAAPVVVDHLACPPWIEGDDEWAAWEVGLTRLAAVPGVVTKLSDLAEPDGDPRLADRVYRAIRLAHDLFGDGRLMYASNWPWPPDTGSQREAYPMRRALAFVERLDADTAAAFFGGTALRVFGITVPGQGA